MYMYICTKLYVLNSYPNTSDTGGLKASLYSDKKNNQKRRSSFHTSTTL